MEFPVQIHNQYLTTIISFETRSGYYNEPTNNLRNCVIVENNLPSLVLIHFCSRDITTVKITIGPKGGGRDIVVSSNYFLVI